ncbi:MAG: hypothetical protein K9N55_06960 [Phycisphaerae bacterium]|nr:hypothetical protein [Phycisphaerae bacterium]
MLLALTWTLTCLAYAWRFNRFSCKTFSFLWEENGQSDVFAGRIETIMIALLLLSAGCIWIKKMRWFALAGAVVMISEAVSETCMPSAKYPGLYWAEWSLRYATVPAAILLFQSWEKARVWSCRIMRVAIAITFLAHGVKALLGDPQFIDYLLVFFRRIGAGSLGEPQALTLLNMIGTVDLLLAAHLLFVKLERNQMVLAWMAAWGAVTALARVTYGGWSSWHEVLIRTSHFVVPVVLLLLVRVDFEVGRVTQKCK